MLCWVLGLQAQKQTGLTLILNAFHFVINIIVFTTRKKQIADWAKSQITCIPEHLSVHFLYPLTMQICEPHPPYISPSSCLWSFFSTCLPSSITSSLPPEPSHHHPSSGPAYLPSSQQGSDIISFQVLLVQSLNPFNKRIKEKQEKTRGFCGPHLAGCTHNEQLSTELWMIKQIC